MPDQDVPAQQESSVEDRLTAYFGGPKVTPRLAEAPPPQQQQEEAPASDEPLAAQPEAEQDTTDQPEQPASDQPPDGYVELEHLGKKWHVPQELKEAFEANRTQATRSAMELAPIRKSLEIEKLAMQATRVADGELKDLAAKRAQLDSYKEQAKRLDWSSLTLDQKVDLDRELRNVDGQIADLDRQISDKRAASQQQFGQFVVAAVQQTENFMAAKVPGWNVDKGKALHEYGLNLGIPAEKLTSGWFTDPMATMTMWKAQQWDALQNAKPAVTNKSTAAPPVIRPNSPAVNSAVRQSHYQKVREDLRKTGTVEAFERALLAQSRRK